MLLQVYITLLGRKSHHCMAMVETASSCPQVQGPAILETLTLPQPEGHSSAQLHLKRSQRNTCYLPVAFAASLLLYLRPGLGTLSSFGKNSELYPPHKAQQQGFLLPEAAFCFSWGWMARSSLFPSRRQASPEQAVLVCNCNSTVSTNLLRGLREHLKN